MAVHHRKTVMRPRSEVARISSPRRDNPHITAPVAVVSKGAPHAHGYPGHCGLTTDVRVRTFNVPASCCT